MSGLCTWDVSNAFSVMYKVIHQRLGRAISLAKSHHHDLTTGYLVYVELYNMTMWQGFIVHTNIVSSALMHHFIVSMENCKGESNGRFIFCGMCAWSGWRNSWSALSHLGLNAQGWTITLKWWDWTELIVLVCSNRPGVVQWTWGLCHVMCGRCLGWGCCGSGLVRSFFLWCRLLVHSAGSGQQSSDTMQMNSGLAVELSDVKKVHFGKCVDLL